MEPRFSVVIPTYNRGPKVSQAIRCVIAQTFEDWELIVVDDGSIDNTSEIVSPFLEDDRVTYVCQKNKGVSAARNLGASKAKGTFLVFFDSDDESDCCWLEDFAEITYSQGSEVGFVSCGYNLVGKACPPRAGREFSSKPYNSASGSFAVRRSVFEDVGGYDECLHQSENWEFVARALCFCDSKGLAVLATPHCNITWNLEKTKSELAQRDFKRAKTYLHLHEKYRTGGVLFHRRKRFLLGAAVNFARSGSVKESRKWFYRSFINYPSLKALVRIVCFEIPILRRKIWLSRRFVIEIADD